MPPKSKGATATDTAVRPEDAALLEECKRLKKKALTLGLLSDEASNPDKKLGVSKPLAKCNGYDIVKRSFNRKNRYLIIIQAQLAPAAAGRLGTLAQLDTKNPVMYLDFPSGRLKLLGTLVFPRSKYVVCKTGSGQVLLEDVFETLVVFSEAHWVGTLQDNPEERHLPMPPELQEIKVHTNYHFTYGAQAKQSDVPLAKAAAAAGATEPGSQEPGTATRAVPPRKAAAKRRYAEDDEEEADDSEEDQEAEQQEDEGRQGRAAALDEDGEVKAPPARRQSAPRQAAAKRSYAEAQDDDAEDGGAEEEEEEEDEAGKKGRAKKSAPRPRQGKADKGEAGPFSKAVDTINLASDNDATPLKKPASKPRQAAGGKGAKAAGGAAASGAGEGDSGRKGRGKAAWALTITSDSLGGSDGGLADTGSQEGVSSGGRKTPARAARTAAAKRLKVVEESEEEGEEEEDSRDGDEDEDFQLSD